MDDYRVPNLVRLAVALDMRLNTETLAMGANSMVPEAVCTAEICGRHLFYLVALVGEQIELRVCPMDGAGELERILSMESDDRGFATMFRLIRACEWSGLERLEPRPLSLGPPCGGIDSFLLA